MYLTKLSSNRNSMKPLEFSPSCVNIILGRKTTDSANKTVNGSGKTLSLRLIDFCLGANITSQLNKLENWEFNLQFKIDKNIYDITRGINTPNMFMVNQTPYERKDFHSFMYNTNFEVKHDIGDLSFRSLISRFMRIPPNAYNSWDKCKEKEQDDTALINNAFLLGLDVELIEKKRIYKSEITLLKNNKKTLKNDNDLKKIIKGTEIGVSITSLKKDIRDLEQKISSFNISQGYNDLKANVENMRERKKEIINRVSYFENVIKNINESLKINIDVTSEQVVNLYQEAKVVFADNIRKTLDDVSNFHIRLLETRKNRLQIDKVKYLNEIEKLKSELSVLDNKINQSLENLKDSGTLAEYESLQNQLYDMRLRLHKMTEYDEILNEIEHKVSDKTEAMAKGNTTALEYLDSISELREQLSFKFKEFVDFIFEESKESGISISVNNKNNKIQFDIIPEISGDTSEGINNVKIFCMDLLYLILQKNHGITFLYHDSTILNGIDPRQIYRMMKLARDICEKNNFQYIINLNYNTFDDLIRSAEAEKVTNKDCDFDNYIKNQIVAELLDGSNENTLLGFYFE